jgi:iron complex transport system substrate-binding protein
LYVLGIPRRGNAAVSRGDTELFETPMRDISIDEVSGQIVDVSFRLHSKLGPGLLESVYESILARSLEGRGLFVERQKSVAFDFEGQHFNDGLRLDFWLRKR